MIYGARTAIATKMMTMVDVNNDANSGQDNDVRCDCHECDAHHRMMDDDVAFCHAAKHPEMPTCETLKGKKKPEENELSKKPCFPNIRRKQGFTWLVTHQTEVAKVIGEEWIPCTKKELSKKEPPSHLI